MVDIRKGDGNGRVPLLYLGTQYDVALLRQAVGVCNDVFVPVAQGESFPSQDERFYIRRSWRKKFANHPSNEPIEP